MKRLIKMLLLIIFTSFPLISVNAFEIACDEGIHEFEEFFTCRLNGAKVGEYYDTLSGTITNNEYVNCLRYTDGVGLSNQNTTDNKAFYYIGKPTTNIVSTFRCQVIKKAEEMQRVQIFINNFKSHTNLQSGTASEEIVRSNYINIAKYVEKTTTASTKPRDTSNSNSRLKTLADNNLNITFSGFITEYNAEVLYEVEKLDLKIYPFNSNANYRVAGSQTLNVGLNVIDIYVTSPDESSTTCYTLNVTRLKEGESIYYPESDASLKNLTVTGFTIGFKPEVSEYKIHLDNQTTKVEVNAIPNVNTATVNISDTNNLTNGSVISVTITSEDLSNQNKYKIIITKDAPKKDYTSYVILGVLAFLGIIVVIIIIYTNKKNKKDPLLRLKNDKRKINKGKKVDPNIIPIAETSQNQVEIPIDQSQTNSNPAPNIIKTDSVNIVEPIQTTEKVAAPNLNNISTNANSLDLNVSAKAIPQAMPVNQVGIEQPMQAIFNNPGVANQSIEPIRQQQPIQGITPINPQVIQQEVVQTQPVQPQVMQVPLVQSQVIQQVPQPQTVQNQPIQPQVVPVSTEPSQYPNMMTVEQSMQTNNNGIMNIDE